MKNKQSQDNRVCSRLEKLIPCMHIRFCFMSTIINMRIPNCKKCMALRTTKKNSCKFHAEVFHPIISRVKALSFISAIKYTPIKTGQIIILSIACNFSKQLLLHGRVVIWLNIGDLLPIPLSLKLL